MRVLFSGSFDPVTNGHVDIISRASRVFDEVLVAVGTHSKKKPTFSLQDRCEMVENEVEDLGLENVTVVVFDGLLVDFVKKNKVQAILRGLRSTADFDYEFKMSSINRIISADVETVFMTSTINHQFTSSAFVKEIALLKGDISSFVSERVRSRLESVLFD